MPKKHAVSFKHLIASSSQDFDRSYPTTSSSNSSVAVKELLDRSRSARPVRPSLAQDVQGEIWVPRPVGRLDLELEQGAEELHPAEHLRRAHLAQRQAQRSVAGPAPPRSWRARPPTAVDTSTSAAAVLAPGGSEVTEHDLAEASRLFSHPRPAPRRRGVAKLSELCFDAITKYLHSDEPLAVAVDDQAGAVMTTTMGRAMREGLGYLDTHLKLAFVAYDACRPSGVRRIGDKALLALLRPCPVDVDIDEPSPSSSDWDDVAEDMATTMTMLVHHLPVTLHPSPHALLRSINHLPTVALTSLDLAYCHLPREADKWTTALPVGLRELGLVGVCLSPTVRSGAKEDRDKDWIRALAQLGRKLLVLRMLDLSYPTFGVDQTLLEALFHPAPRQLPSLRLLGLRGLAHSDTGSNHTESAEGGNPKSSIARPGVARRKELLGTIRKDRTHFIEVIWE